MDAVTYPVKEVKTFVENYLIPLRINVNDDPVHDKYHYFWTPTIAVLNLGGDEVQRTIGFFDSKEFIASMHLGIAKVHLDAEEYDTANVHLKKLLEKYPQSEMIPEAIYFRGVNLYKWKDNPSHLREAYETLVEKYPETAWTQRAYPYRLI
jgi:tetratricopeptide (TPR) repeat protein